MTLALIVSACRETNSPFEPVKVMYDQARLVQEVKTENDIDILFQAIARTKMGGILNPEKADISTVKSQFVIAKRYEDPDADNDDFI
jgi:hypothetical protein